MQAVLATLAGRPRAIRRWKKAYSGGLWRIAVNVRMYRACGRWHAAHDHATPRKQPLSR